MARTFEEQKKKQQFLILIFLGVFFTTGVVAYISFFRGEVGDAPISDFSFLAEEPTESREPPQPIARPKDIDKLLKTLQEFKSHTPIPIPISRLGNVNPFGGP